MPIQILPARLANQIAAGEVVERPASVVKELLENSLDSGATNIEIEIEKGGHKRILIRDNGSGIPKEELALALSRHATSKIANLDDLEAICTLGFRGEALASISSVARLSLSSKPSHQSQAWQARSEGRDMQVQLNPVAHPDGTSVEVVDLFFNTPARRKFLRTEKTEFAHIDELVRRIALSRFDVSFSLKHNQNVLRKYPAVKSPSNSLKRLGAICGKEFTQDCIELNSQYQQFELKGWLAEPAKSSKPADYQYFYVNGRMMRDKLINHAIRQAFEGLVAENNSLDYVLYLTLEPDQVDVNVHPAKHEVRFHQARIVHDFIFRALNEALSQYFEQGHSQIEPKILPPVEPKHDYIQPLQSSVKQGTPDQSHSSPRTKMSLGIPKGSLNTQSARDHLVNSARVMENSAHNYQQLMSPIASHSKEQDRKDLTPNSLTISEPGHWIRVSDDHILGKVAAAFYLISVETVHKIILQRFYKNSVPTSQPLLMPISIAASSKLLDRAKNLYQPLVENGVEIGWTPNRIILRKVPAGFRQFRWAECLTDILGLNKTDVDDVREHLLTCLARYSQLSNEQIQSWWSETSDIERVVQSIGQMMPLSGWFESHVE